MYRHSFRKSLGLFVLYSVLIIGIFVLQFKNESVVSKNIGLLSVSFAQTQQENGEISLKNDFQVNFKGISFFSDEVTPITLIMSDNSQSEPLNLISCAQETPLSYKFNFTNNVSLTFSVSDTKSTASMSINASLPENSKGLYLNYKPTSGFSVTEKSKARILLSSKSLAYNFNAPKIEEHRLFFTGRTSTAYYAPFNEKDVFKFASIDTSLIIAQKSTYDANILQLRENIVSSVKNSINLSQSLSEKAVIAYIAELASQNQYSLAVSSIPDSFKNGNKRTYLSSPYLNNLDAMYPSLVMHNENMAEMISNALASNSLSIFTMDELADYLNIYSDNQKVKDLLDLPSQIILSNESELKVSIASGILCTYLKLSSLHSSLADKLLPVIDLCLKTIESNCIFVDSIVQLVEKDSQISNSLALETGNALIKWGEFNSAEEYKTAGYCIINSILSTTTLEQIAMADVYPVLINNEYYPHFVILQRNSSSPVWAWTCAASVSYSMQNNTAAISTRFNKGDSHYMMLCGIKEFSEIEIYGLSFHSDPRFETYNSSGFIYKNKNNTLLLKYRHKNDTELVRLSYNN
ncbi:hypothetical protein [Treponema sp.]|uniref:hypothetical protein n=1 Tax=Treponema sp. TaxID=166 RepID=UPI00388D6729